MLFDKIIYINLDRRPDRNENMINILKKHNLMGISERFSAVDGSNLDLNKISNKLITKKGIVDAKKSNKLYTVMTPGAIGCALSHHHVYKKIVDEKINRCLILEDDIELVDNFNEMVDDIEKNKPLPDYDLFFLGYHKSALRYPYQCERDDLCEMTRVYGLFGYIVTFAGAKKLLEIFPITRQIDSEISDNSDWINLLALEFNKTIIKSDQSSIYTKFGTDIQVRDSIEEFNKESNYSEESILMIAIFILIGLLYYFSFIQKK